MLEFNLPSPLQKINHPLLVERKCELWIKRDDQIHDLVSGNKWRKLLLNLKQAKAEGKGKILTFGGAFSNHIAATAAIAERLDLEMHAMIRGEELNKNSNYCLRRAHQSGLNLHFISRSNYAKIKGLSKGSEIGKAWKDAFLIPEGGANEHGVQGCELIYPEISITFDHLICAAGTGTTAAGILRSLKDEKLYVISALKGGQFLRNDILKWQKDGAKTSQLQLLEDYHFGGFGKVPSPLLVFQKECAKSWDIELDYLYTAKAFYALLDLIERSHFSPYSKIVFYHSGGLQGNRAVEKATSQ